ncbi:MAG: hypothetical protein NT062_24700, partial [Proteobacteria bacterium]|nr:hypothetical protein [Pseudomonadota bacterium]
RIDGFVLLDKLRQHQRAVRDGRPGRDVKLIDDELRQATANFCDPCNRWVPDRVTIDELYPLDRIDDAARAVCLGFEFHDGTTVYGAARPRACR